MFHDIEVPPDPYNIPGYEEFWFDAVILYKALRDEGYTDDHIFLLYGKGNDYVPTDYPIAPKYAFGPNNPDYPARITDYPARIQDVQNIFNWLSVGNPSEGITALTDDDFLFVWTFGHGGYHDDDEDNVWEYGEETTIGLIDDDFQTNSHEAMLASEFINLLNQIHYNRRAIWMAQCCSGGFVEPNYSLANSPKTTVLTSCATGGYARQADQRNCDPDPINNSYYSNENETIVYKGVSHQYAHSEFNLHTMATLTGKYPDGSSCHSNPDLNGDGEVSNFETSEYNLSWNSLISCDLPGGGSEMPTWTDNGQIGGNTSLTYPTLLFDNIIGTDSYKGIIGISRDINIKQGTEINFMPNSIVYVLPDNGHIFIERGGTLIIDGSHLTSNSYLVNNNQNFWGGIQVWGSNTEPQNTPGAQGKLIIKNDAIIENAINAVNAIRSETVGGYELYYWDHTGGIIQANDVTFRNNKNAVWFGSYHNFILNNTDQILPNLSGFYNSIFEITDAYNTNMGMPHEFIGLYDVEWIKIYGNIFRNLNTSMIGSDRGNGIVSYDASYIAKDFCSTSNFPCPLNEQIPNTFTNLNCAISSSNNGTAKSVIINNNVFTDNNYSIILKSIKNAKIINNEFNVGKRLGLSLLNCTAYQVEENSFSSDDITLNYGLNIMKSGIQPNLIYRNKFYDGLSVACHPISMYDVGYKSYSNSIHRQRTSEPPCF